MKKVGDRITAKEFNDIAAKAGRGWAPEFTQDQFSQSTTNQGTEHEGFAVSFQGSAIGRHSVVGMGTIADWKPRPTSSIGGQIGPNASPAGSPFQYFTNGGQNIPSGNSTITLYPIEYNRAVLLRTSDTDTPVPGNLCGPEPDTHEVSINYTGFICLSGTQMMGGSNVAWFMLWQSSHLLVEAESDIPFFDVETDTPGEGFAKILQRVGALAENVSPITSVPVQNIGGLIEDKSSPIFAVPTLGVGLVVDNPLQFGTANGTILAGTIIGRVNVFGMNAAETDLVTKVVVQEQVHFLHLENDEGTPANISNGKEVVIHKVNGRWHVLHAECENEPASETPMAATALKTTTPDSPYQAVPGDLVLVDSTGGDFTVDAPPSPVKDNRFGVLKVVGQADNFVIVDAGTDTIIPLSNISPPGSPTTAALQAAFELGIWRWNGTEWHVENNAHTPALVQAYRVKALPIIGLGVGVVLQWDHVPLFTGQAETAIIRETGTFVDSRFNIQADLTADVELSLNFDHRLTGNNQNTQLNVTNNYQAASGPGILLMGDVDAPYADPRTITVLEDKDKKGVMFSRATDTLEFTASGTGTGLIDLRGAVLTFTIG